MQTISEREISCLEDCFETIGVFIHSSTKNMSLGKLQNFSQQILPGKLIFANVMLKKHNLKCFDNYDSLNDIQEGMAQAIIYIRSLDEKKETE